MHRSLKSGPMEVHVRRTIYGQVF